MRYRSVQIISVFLSRDFMNHETLTQASVVYAGQSACGSAIDMPRLGIIHCWYKEVI